MVSGLWQFKLSSLKATQFEVHKGAGCFSKPTGELQTFLASEVGPYEKVELFIPWSCGVGFYCPFLAVKRSTL